MKQFSQEMVQIMGSRESFRSHATFKPWIKIYAALFIGLTLLCQTWVYAESADVNQQVAQLAEHKLPERLILQEPISSRPTKAWQQVWADLWGRMGIARRLEVASSVKAVPVCQGALQLDRLVHDAIEAISLNKHGDAARILGTFQDKSMCLTRNGMRELDLVLTLFVDRALTLSADKARFILPGLLNVGFLAYDQLQYTKTTFWQLGLASNVVELRRVLGRSAADSQAVWLYDLLRGQLVQKNDQRVTHNMLSLLSETHRVGDGSCSLLEMVERSERTGNGLECPQGGQQGAGGTAVGGGSATGGATGNGARCILEAASNVGVRGQLNCMQRALAGATLTPQQVLAGLPSSDVPIHDKQCARSEGEGSGVTSGLYLTKEEKERIGALFDAIRKYAILDQELPEVLTDELDRTMQYMDALSAERSQQQAILDEQSLDATKKLTEALKAELEAKAEAEARAREAEAAKTLSEEAAKKAEEARKKAEEAAKKAEEARKQKEEAKKKAEAAAKASAATSAPSQGRTVDDGLGGTSGCGNRSNAARRVQALYQCTSGESGGTTHTFSGAHAPTHGGLSGNSNIMLVDPEQTTSPISTVLSCAVQAGDLQRISTNDPKCGAMRCFQDRPCPCNKIQLEENRTQVRPPGGIAPDCIGEGPCGVSPMVPGGSTPVDPRRR